MPTLNNLLNFSQWSVAGPDEGTLLIAWIPVVINVNGMNNGNVVIGYAIYCDGRQVSMVDGAMKDHAIVELARFSGFQGMIKGRTIS